MPALYISEIKVGDKKLTFIFLERFYGRKKSSTTILGNRFPAGDCHHYDGALSSTL